MGREVDPIGWSGSAFIGRVGTSIYLFNECGHGGCWTTSDERATLDKGDFLGYYPKACEGGDLNACFFYGVASGANPGPGVALRQGLINNGYSVDQAYSLVKTTIPLDLATDYANLLPQSADQAVFPSAQGIAGYHWSEFRKFVLPPSTFGGTPFGTGADSSFHAYGARFASPEQKD